MSNEMAASTVYRLRRHIQDLIVAFFLKTMWDEKCFVLVCASTDIADINTSSNINKMCALNKEKTKDASLLMGQHSSPKAKGGKVVQLWYQKKKKY